MPAPEPVIVFPAELPVSAARDEIARAIRDHQVVIVAGATGSGKTTQLPKICLELGRARIAHTQPRRLAARTIAERIAQELQVPLGTTVGYRVRFTDAVSEDTRVAVMTDGILLNEIHRDRQLRRYDTIIIDEAHERSLNVDFLLGYLRRLLPQRPDLRVIITSATIDPGSFARHFAPRPDDPQSAAPVIEVSGRTFPVEIRYRPHDEAAQDDVDGLVAALRELDREPPGDVLVFLPGEAEIKDAMDAVRGMYQRDASPTEVLPLYGRLSAAEQHRVFESSSVAGVRRRVILATNVAETSLTVPGIRYVIDTGTARISRYSARSKIQRLPIEAISQASAQQRSGRAGRTAPGIAIRLYSEEDFAARPEFTEPEILRTSLAAVLLQMLALGIGDVDAFPFLTPPDSRGVKAALDLLLELGAIRPPETGARSRSTRLTGIGKELARLPIDPRMARMLLEARTRDVLTTVLPIVAGMSIQDVRERPEERREEADRAHARFADPTSDFLTLLNLWNHLQEQQRELGSSAFRRMCRAEHLNYVRVREWSDVHRQLSDLLSVRRPRENVTADPDLVHRAILAGLLSHIGILDERTAAAPRTGARAERGRPSAEYRGARGTRFAIFPGSALRKKQPAAVMAAELVETSRLFARTAAAIDPAWAEELAGELAHRQLGEPHWSRAAGAASAYEKVTLFGVEIIGRRRVQLARFDRPLARELFLRHALVAGEWDVAALDKRLSAFERRNTELRRRLEKLEERERRRDILAGDEAVFAFYDSRIPRDVYDVRSFETWWKDAATRTPRLLDLSESDLTERAAAAGAEDYPSRWEQADQTLTLAYRFEPGAPDDGVNVVVPLALLTGLRTTGFDWQVPGMRDELIAGLLRALPKSIRRHVVPAADWAARFAEELRGEGPEHSAGEPTRTLRAALAQHVQRVAHQPVTAEDFDMARVPPHLGMAFRVIDGRGRTVGSGRDLSALQEQFADLARGAVVRSLERAGTGSPTPRRGRADVSRASTPTASPDTAASAPSVESSVPNAGASSTESATAAGFSERRGARTWDFDDLPGVVDARVPGGVVRGYPAIVDDGDSVSLRIEATAIDASTATHRGVRRLLLLSAASPESYVLEHLTAAEKLALATSPYPSARALIEDCRVALADAVLARVGAEAPVRTRAAFETARDAFAAESVDGLFAAVALTSRILTAHREVDRGMRDLNAMTLLAALGDLRSQLDALVFPGFVSRTGLTRLAHFPRYLAAAADRVRALAENPGRDRQRLTEYERAATAYREAGGTLPSAADAPPHLVQARWMLEEYRVSLFAQGRGTAEPVSLPRILKTLR